jgi:hypothetical protein
MKKALLLLFLLPSAAFAQEEEKIETDRPDQTETSAIVPRGRFQMENGFIHTKEEASSHEMMLPTALSKFGVTDNVEVRLITNLVYNKTPDSTTVGIEPVTIGFKVNLWKQKGLLPETSFIGEVMLPNVASKKYKQQYLAPELQLLFSNKITDKFAIGYNLDVTWNGESAMPGYEYTVSPEFEVSDKISVFIELYGFLEEHSRTDNWADSGFKFFINKNIQLDIAGGYELTAHNHYHRFYETIGFSFRI